MRYIWVLLLVVLTGQAWAAPVVIRTGEHATFTRVVLDIPSGSRWRMGRSGDRYVIRLNVDDGFDTRTFFDIIPRTRISDVAQNIDAGELELSLACRCYADAILLRPDTLVIDVRDGLPPAESPFEVALDRPTAPVILPIVPALQQLPVSPPAPLIITLPPSTTTPVQQDISALERSVGESLARAMAQGLLSQRREAVTEADAAIPEFTIEPLDDTDAPGLRASTSIDRDAFVTPADAPLTQAGEVCLPSEYFEVSSWGDDRPFSMQMVERRAGVTGEFDRVDANAVTAFAKLYLYFGFGREAIQMLELDGVMSQERSYLSAIARIIDEDPIDPMLFQRQASCASAVALWALLAQSDGPLDAQVDRISVLREFKSLPFHLQTHLGPVLSDRFIAMGDADGASQALSVGSTSPDRPVAVDIAETQLMKETGNDAAALAQLSKIADSNVRMTPEAMIRLLRDSISNDVTVDEADFVLAETLRFENAQSPVAKDLAIAQARAYVHGQRFDAAVDLIELENIILGSELRGVLYDEVAQAAVTSMGDVPFLEFAFGEIAEDVRPKTQHALAARLIRLGFPQRALDLIAQNAAPDDMSERRYLRAQAAIDIGDSEGARGHLLGITTDRAQSLLAQIEQTDTPAPRIATNFWREGDWAALARSDDVLLTAASLAVLEEVIGQNPDSPLTSGRRLLDQSIETRNVVEDLMARFAAPSDF